MFSPTRTAAITSRVLKQILGDHRTVALMLFVPSILTGLFSWMLNSQKQFDNIGPRLIGLFPFMVMFLLSSITTLKERRSGTLERFFTMPMRKEEFIIGYALAFGIMATLQAGITLAVSINFYNLSTGDHLNLLVVAAVSNAILGMSLGLLASAFAETEFQVIQFLPAFIFPQIILGGLFLPTKQMPDILQTVSDWLPLTHALKALTDIASSAKTADIETEIWIVVGVSLASLLLGSLTLRKRTN